MAQGNEVHVAGGLDGHAIAPALRQAFETVGVTVHVLSYLGRSIHLIRDFKALGEMRLLLGTVAPDLISLHSSKAGWLGRYAAKRFNKGARGAGLADGSAQRPVPVLFTAHGWAFTGGIPDLRARIYRVLECRAAHVADAIICVSEADRRLAEKAGIASRTSVVAIHNGMPDVSEALRADLRSVEPAGAPDVPVRIVMVDIALLFVLTEFLGLHYLWSNLIAANTFEII